MGLNIRSFWQETPELQNIVDATEWTATSVGAGLGLAVALGVASPMIGIAAASLAFASPIKKLTEVALSKHNQPLLLEEVVTIVAPLAYIKSFNYFEASGIAREKLKNNISHSNKVRAIVSEPELNRELAVELLRSFHKSNVIRAFNEILSRHLELYNFSRTESDATVTWVSWRAQQYFRDELRRAIASEDLDIQDHHLINIHLLSSDQDESHPCYSIEKYINEQISAAVKHKVFKEDFDIESIYVPLKIKAIESNGHFKPTASEELIDDWARRFLLSPNRKQPVMFIQGGPGRGKSAFCQVFSNWVKNELYPWWIPILIKLREVDSFDSFEDTLRSGLRGYSFSRDEDWLSEARFRFLFILDGFDELPLKGRANRGLKDLIGQAAFEQSKYSSGSERGHQFMITGRQLALQGISFLPDNLARVELLAMDNKLQDDWLNRWVLLVDKDRGIARRKVDSFRRFLRSPKLPREVREELAREPLLFYLLASMHRDDDISLEKLSGDKETFNKVSIYEGAIDSVLQEQRDISIQREIVNLDISQLKQILIEAGLAATQSGRKSAKLSTIEIWLSRSWPVIAEKIKRIRESDNDEILKNALSAFYLKPNSETDDDGSVEFFHTSFREFFCAKHIHQSFDKWIQWDEKFERYVVEDSSFHKEFYEVFGYGSMTQEIVEYLFVFMEKAEVLYVKRLFSRLKKFYRLWCDGVFINTTGTTFAQATIIKLKKELPVQDSYLGQNEVEVFTLLNALMILFELHRFCVRKNISNDELSFHPCEKVKNQDGKYEVKDKELLLRIIDLSNSCLGSDGFSKTIGGSLHNIDLSYANLSGAKLSGANLSGTDLSQSSLRQTDLKEANLIDTILHDADMCRCDLTGAELKNAKLTGAYLRGTDCRNAKFNQAVLHRVDFCRAYLYNSDFNKAELCGSSVKNANLSSANFTGADFHELKWNIGTSWLHSQGLHSTRNTPNKLFENLEFQDATELSMAYSNLDSGNIETAISIAKEVAERISTRLEDLSFEANIYNRFAWLCSLLNNHDQCRDKIFSLADRAVTLEKTSGNYKDTLAIAVMFNPNFYAPPPIGVNVEGYDEDGARENPYQYAIKLLEEALECDDFKMLALPNMDKIRQRRIDWIDSLKNRINPLNSQEIALLLKEEY